ncbi:hypothetical protein ACFWY6_41810 [Streptomyces sp. NPDC059037]|uniref:hypothetical protein n=1 Tax=Streptomyces sp. NPDC059037 TaxID=3346710 RepID=UPI0036788846
MHTAGSPHADRKRRTALTALRDEVDEVSVLLARRNARRLIRQMGLRPRDGLPQLLAAVEQRRRKRIIVLERPLPPDVSGLHIETAEADIILIDTGATRLLRLVILLHELRHLLQDTGGRTRRLRLWAARWLARVRVRIPQPRRASDPDHSLLPPGLLSAVLPTLPPHVARSVQGRTLAVNMRAPQHERLDQAEVFAREALNMLALQGDPAGTGAITSSLEHRGTGI